MPKISEEQKLERIRIVLDAAIDVFSVNGFSATTVDQIAEKAGVSKGLLYTYFKSKEEIFFRLIPHIDEMTKREDVLFDFLEQSKGMSVTERLLHLWDLTISEWTEDDLRLSRLQIEFWLEASKNSNLRETLIKRSNKSMDLIRRIIEEADVHTKPFFIESFGRLWWAQIDGLVSYFVSHNQLPERKQLIHMRSLISKWCNSCFCE